MSTFKQKKELKAQIAAATKAGKSRWSAPIQIE